MAVAAPVLERTTEDNKSYAPSRVIFSNEEDEKHNAKMSVNLAKLLNPSAKMSDFDFKSPAEEQSQPVSVQDIAAAEAPAVAPETAPAEARPYFVENARADAAIFRADNPINMVASAPVTDEIETEEEENEDLRPTQTTIQYKTAGKSTVEEGKIKNASAEKRVGLTKKEKIIIAVVVSVIVALLALIIINSAIITNLNGDLSSLQSHLSNVKSAASGLNNQITDLLETEGQRIKEFAQANGMISPY